MDTEDTAIEDSEGSEEHVNGDQRKENPCYLVAENLVTLSPAIMLKAELVSNELAYIIKEFTSEVLKVTTGLFLLLIVK